MLEIKNGWKSFDRCLFKNLDLSFPDQGLFFIIGDSGCGKSTLLHILAGLEPLDKGDIYYQNKRIEDFLTFRKEYVTFLFQEYGLIESHSLKTNLLLPQLQLKRGSEDSDLKNVLNKLDIHKELKKNCLDYSGGEKQRIALARLLLYPKRIILCDEPTGSLDPENSEYVFSILKELSKNHLVLVVTHDEMLAKQFGDGFYYFEQDKKIINNEVNDSIIIDENKEFVPIKIKQMMELSFSSLLFRKGRALLSVFGYVFVMIFLLFCIALQYSIPIVMANQTKRYMDFNKIQVSLEETSKIGDTHFSFIKSIRPEYKEIEKLMQGFHYELNYCFDAIFSCANIYIDHKKIDIQIKPVHYLHHTLYESYQTQLDGMGIKDVFLNKSAAKLWKNNARLLLKCPIETFDEYFNRSSDSLIIDFPLKKCAVVDEFELMPLPTIYVSYTSYAKYLREVEMKNASILLKKKVTYYDRLTYLSKKDEEISSYCFDLYLQENEVIKAKEKLEKEGYSIYSYALETGQNLSQILSSIQQVLQLFVFLSFIIVLFLVGMILYSFVIDRKKEIGLLQVYGVHPKSISMMFCLEGASISFISGVIAMVLISPLFMVTNFLIKKYFYLDNLLRIPHVYFINSSIVFWFLFLLGSSLIGIFSGFIPSYFIRKIKVSDVLREE